MNTYFAKDLNLKLPKRANPPQVYEDRILAQCKENGGYEFLGFIGDWKGNETKIMIRCDKGHEYEAHQSNFYHHKKKCAACVGGVRKSADDAMVEIKDTLDKRGYTLLEVIGGVYRNTKTRFKVQCDHGHTYDTTFSSIVYKKVGCKFCANNIRKSNERIITEIEERNPDYQFIEFVGGDFKNARTKIRIKCNHGHVYETNYTKIRYGCRCPKCDGRGRGKGKDINDIRRDIDSLNTGYKFHGFDGEYKNLQVKMIMECTKGHVYKVRYSKFMAGQRCPTCAPTGYDPDKTGFVYVQKLYKDGEYVGIKFGITNNDPKLRMDKQSSKSCLTHELYYCKEYRDGKAAYNKEAEIKRTFKKFTRHISKEDMPDGWTETLPPEYLDRVLDMIGVNFDGII